MVHDVLMQLPMEFCYLAITSTVNQQILAAIKFGVSQNKVIWRLLNLASRLCSARLTYRPMLAVTNISENTQFAKYNSTPKFVDLQYSTFRYRGHAVT